MSSRYDKEITGRRLCFSRVSKKEFEMCTCIKCLCFQENCLLKVREYELMMLRRLIQIYSDRIIKIISKIFDVLYQKGTASTRIGSAQWWAAYSWRR